MLKLPDYENKSTVEYHLHLTVMQKELQAYDRAHSGGVNSKEKGF